MTWSDAVDQALCFGWIDSVARRTGETSRVQRFTPRKPKSNWSAVNAGLSELYIPALAIDPVSPNTVYAALNFGGVAKTTNGGSLWSPANTGLPSYSITALAVAPSEPRVLYAGTTVAGVYRSGDGGASWTVFNAGIENRWIISLAVDPQISDRVHAGSVDGGAFENEPSTASPSSSGAAAPALAGPHVLVFSPRHQRTVDRN